MAASDQGKLPGNLSEVQRNSNIFYTSTRPALGTGSFTGLPLFADPDNGDFSLLPGSPALNAGPLGDDLGALVSDQIRITGEPPAFTTSTSATLTVGGPGLFGYRYRVNDGPWSADLDIGNAGGLVPGQSSN